MPIALFTIAMTHDHQQELREIILELRNDIGRMAERQSEMNENIKKIKERNNWNFVKFDFFISRSTRVMNLI